MIRRLSRLVSLLLVGLAASSAAPLPAAAPTAAPAPAWPLPPLDYFIHKLPPPPQPGSWRDRMDLSDLVARQQMVTQADLKSIARTPTQRPPALRRVFDFRAHFCHSPPMETDAFSFRLPANPPDCEKPFPISRLSLRPD